MSAAGQVESQATSPRWNRNFDLLERFTREHGRLPKRRSTNPEEVRLDRWLSDQRRRYRGTLDKSLSREQRAKIEQIPGFEAGRRSESWDEKYRRLTAFVEEHGRLPRSKAQSEEEHQMYTWLTYQRDRIGVNGRGAALLSTERQAKMWAIPGFRPTVRATYVRKPRRQ